jgi:hypothetical protein
VGVNVRAFLHLISSQGDMEFAVFPVHLHHRERRHQHLPACQPVAGIDDDIAQHPSLVIEIESLDISDLPVRRDELEAIQVIDIA